MTGTPADALWTEAADLLAADQPLPAGLLAQLAAERSTSTLEQVRAWAAGEQVKQATGRRWGAALRSNNNG